MTGEYKNKLSLKYKNRVLIIETDNLNDLIGVGWFRLFIGLESPIDLGNDEDEDDELVEKAEEQVQQFQEVSKDVEVVEEPSQVIPDSLNNNIQ